MISSAQVLVWRTLAQVHIEMGSALARLWLADALALLRVPEFIIRAGVNVVDAFAHTFYVVPEKASVTVHVISALASASRPVELERLVACAIATTLAGCGVPNLVEVAGVWN